MHPDACEFHLWGLYVTLEDRGGPAAQALISAALTWCRQQPHQQAVGLHVHRSNVRAQHWFGRFGFRRVEDETLRRTQLVARSEEHTSELQSLMRISYAVFCLKKKKK